MNRTGVAATGVAVAALSAAGMLLLDRRNDARWGARSDEESIVMLGDSLTEQGNWGRLFPDLPIVNAGRSGLTTAELVPVASEIAATHPRLVVILTGTNDIRDRHDPAWTRRYLGEVIDAVRSTSPTTTIIVQTVLPRSDRLADVIATNDAIRTIADDEALQLLDLYTVFDAGTGALRDDETSDGVHLSEAGYRRWAAALRPFLPTERTGVVG